MAVVTYGSAGVTARPVVLPVEESSQVGEARRAAVALAESLGFDATDQGRVALVATEAATNLVKHARRGVVVVQAPRARADGDAPPFVELMAIDRGPGMADATHALRDGYSTAGTSGAGLGAIARTADLFEIDSYPGKGTVVLAQVWPSDRRPGLDDGPDALAIGAVCVPIHGESQCGDAWAIVVDAQRAVVLVADGLGHGPVAAVAAEAASQALVTSARAASQGPADLLQRAHGALRATRGAAVAVATLDATLDALRFAGIGNVAGTLGAVENPSAWRSLVSLNGIVGHQMRSPNEFPYAWAPGTLLVLATDGVRPQWRLEDYPGLTRRHPAIVAATLWRDHTRERDDASVLVVRRPPPRTAA